MLRLLRFAACGTGKWVAERSRPLSGKPMLGRMVHAAGGSRCPVCARRRGEQKFTAGIQHRPVSAQNQAVESPSGKAGRGVASESQRCGTALLPRAPCALRAATPPLKWHGIHRMCVPQPFILVGFPYSPDASTATPLGHTEEYPSGMP